LIQRHRWFWWLICGAVPLLAITQIVLNQGDGAFAAVASGLVLLLVWAWRCGAQGRRPHQRAVLAAVALLIAAGLLALLAAWALDGGGFMAQLVQRNAEQLAPAAPDAKRRIVLWPAYLRAWWEAPWLGVGIPAIAPGSPECTPHNLWLGLLYWTGLVGTGFAALLATAFVPRRWPSDSLGLMVPPLLLSLFLYQLVDDIWLRPLALALLLVLLPGLKLPDSGRSPASQSQLPPQQQAPQRWLQRFAFPAATYRLLAVVGVLLITLSTVVPGGVGFGPSAAVAMPKASCLLFF
jgi:hypothetical protein